MRAYKPEQIQAQELDAVLEAGTYAPTLPEVVITVGIFALGVGAFTALSQLLLKK